jgi:hypothetical protein
VYFLQDDEGRKMLHDFIENKQIIITLDKATNNVNQIR